MNVTSIKFQNNICFKSVRRTVYKDINTGNYGVSLDETPKESCLCYKNNTRFFRNDINTGSWQNFIDKILNEFNDANKVHVYDFACSDGSEPYSLAISLLENLGEEGAKKYFPIYASDIDDEMIKRAKEYKIECDKIDLLNIIQNTGNNLEKYFNFQNSESDRYCYCLEAKPILKNAIKFKQADILEEIDSVEPSNSLILCRNFWPYLEKEQIGILIKKLSKIDLSSRIVMGDFDFNISSKLQHGDYSRQFHETFSFLPSSYSHIYKKR